MQEAEIAPIKENLGWWDELEKIILDFFRENIYLPLIQEIPGVTKKLLNSKSPPLIEAILSGRVWFYRGEFKGRFSAATSKELGRLGAKWDRRTRTFKILQSSLPDEVKHAISLSEMQFTSVLQAIDRKLSEMGSGVAEKFSATKFFDKTLWRINKDINKSVKGLVVPADLSDEARVKIAEGYTENLQKYIKDFSDEQILGLRAEIKESTFAGQRYETLVKQIQHSFAVSHNKAKFLARQETGLLMAKFKEARYVDMGSKEYVWGCVKAANVRPSHKRLEGKKFRWDTPPVTTDAGARVQRRNNPQEDYGCRCFARPIIKF